MTFPTAISFLNKFPMPAEVNGIYYNIINFENFY